jgi:hypothetical protein
MEVIIAVPAAQPSWSEQLNKAPITPADPGGVDAKMAMLRGALVRKIGRKRDKLTDCTVVKVIVIPEVPMQNATKANLQNW